jgi:hypothetical protein
MKKQILTLCLLVTTLAVFAQPARVPVNETSSGGNTKPINNGNNNNNNNNNNNTGSNTSSELKKYNDPKGRFTIGYPGEWKLNESSEDAVLQITSPQENDNDQFKQNINLQIEEVNSSVTIDDYVKTNMDGVKEIIKNYREVSAMFFNRNGSRAYQVVYKGKYGTMAYELQIKQLFTISNGKAYILTYVSKENERDAFETTANKIFNSFKY